MFASFRVIRASATKSARNIIRLSADLRGGIRVSKTRGSKKLRNASNASQSITLRSEATTRLARTETFGTRSQDF